MEKSIESGFCPSFGIDNAVARNPLIFACRKGVTDKAGRMRIAEQSRNVAIGRYFSFRDFGDDGIDFRIMHNYSIENGSPFYI